MNKTLFLSTVAALSLQASTIELEALSVEASSLRDNELNAPRSVEIFTREDIQKAHVQTLPEFLQKQSSLNIVSSFGNPFSPKMDLRGYGIERGNSNIVVRINGRRINNIDNVPQLLGSISPSNIERIEISKGSGIVANGDGANAGVIDIITDIKDRSEVDVAIGSQSTSQSSLFLSRQGEIFSAALSADLYKTDGTRVIDNEGNSDEKKLSNVALDLSIYPTEEMELRLGIRKSSVDAIYGSYLSLDEYNADPSQPGATNSGASKQNYDSRVFSGGLSYELSTSLLLRADYSNEYKDAKNTYSSGFVDPSQYRYENITAALEYSGDHLQLISGFEAFLGNRNGYGGDIDKNNYAGYLLGEYRQKAHTLKAGYRYERAFYRQDATASDNTKAYTLHGSELGYSYVFEQSHSVFASYQHSYQSANIDQLLVYVFPVGGVFENFLDPMQVKTYTLGYNKLSAENKFKLSLFYADLKNEFYYYTGPGGTFDPASKNTNIDASSKYGIELYDSYNINQNWNLSGVYNFVRAKVDEEVENSEVLSGTTLPGVPKHVLKATLNYYPNAKTALALVQNYRSEAYALNDMHNDFAQKQEQYLTTDISLTYSDANYEVFAKINNLFDQSNGLWVRDDAIYPVDFRLTMLFGTKLKF